jgi:hypothetical protein
MLETTFTTSTGTAVLTDAMALDPTEHGHDLGAGAPRVRAAVEESRGSASGWLFDWTSVKAARVEPLARATP